MTQDKQVSSRDFAGASRWQVPVHKPMTFGEFVLNTVAVLGGLALAAILLPLNF